jgi:predicted nucleic acid-binding protein
MADTYVVDCSVAAKWLLPEPGRDAALAWFDRYAAGTVALIAPDLLLAEFASLLAKRSRRKQIAIEAATDAYGLLSQSAPRLFSTRPLLESALVLSLRRHLSLWDCVYLALAAEHACPLLTADRRLFRASTGHPELVLVA